MRPHSVRRRRQQTKLSPGAHKPSVVLLCPRRTEDDERHGRRARAQLPGDADDGEAVAVLPKSACRAAQPAKSEIATRVDEKRIRRGSIRRAVHVLELGHAVVVAAAHDVFPSRRICRRFRTLTLENYLRHWRTST